MSSVEVLREQITGCELMKGSELYDAHTKALHKAYLEALLALEKQDKLKEWLDKEIGYLEEEKHSTCWNAWREGRLNGLKEVRGFLNE